MGLISLTKDWIKSKRKKKDVVPEPRNDRYFEIEIKYDNGDKDKFVCTWYDLGDPLYPIIFFDYPDNYSILYLEEKSVKQVNIKEIL